MKKIPIRQISESHKELSSSERFTIRRVEDILGGNDLAQELHRHDFFFILALQYGKGHHEIDFTPYKIVDNAVFILRPGQVHRLELKAGCSGYLVEFNTEFYHPTGKASSQRLRKASNKNYCLQEPSRFNKLQVHTNFHFPGVYRQGRGFPGCDQSKPGHFLYRVGKAKFESQRTRNS